MYTTKKLESLTLPRFQSARLKYLIYLTLLIFIMLLGSTSRSTASGIDSNWVKIADTAGVKVYYEITTCGTDSISSVFVNFYNSNSDSVKIDWEDMIKDMGLSINTSRNGTKEIVLSNGAVTGNDCSSKDANCLIQAKDWMSVSKSTITDYKLTKLTITKL